MQAYYSGSAAGSKSIPRGDSITLGLNSRAPLLLAQPSYAPKTKLLGGQALFGIGFGYGRWAPTTANASPTSALGTPRSMAAADTYLTLLRRSMSVIGCVGDG